MLPRIAIIGRPNVGKSTLFNRIAQERISIVDDTKGVTRDRLYTKAEWLGKEFILIDTGGIEQTDVQFMEQIALQAEIAIEEADIIIFVTNVMDGVTIDDEHIAKLLYQSKKSIIIAANHVDSGERKNEIYDFYQLGFEDVIGISAVHGIGIGDLLEKAFQIMPKNDIEEYDESVIRFSLIGRPNVGKSSLVNALLGEERVIVSDIAGTTRDAIDTPFTYYGQEYAVIDTAGIRRKGKVSEKIEKYSVLRALSAVERSDIILIVLDAETGIEEQDKKIAGIAVDSGKGIIFVVNKWDAVAKDDNMMEQYKLEIHEQFKFAEYVPIVFLSALTKKRVHTLFPIITYVSENQNRRISTSVLNDILQEAFILNPAPLKQGKRLKLLYGTQVSVKPPTFVLHVNDEELAHFSYKRYIDNQIRDAFDFEGTSIRVIYRTRRSDHSE